MYVFVVPTIIGYLGYQNEVSGFSFSPVGFGGAYQEDLLGAVLTRLNRASGTCGRSGGVTSSLSAKREMRGGGDGVQGRVLLYIRRAGSGCTAGEVACSESRFIPIFVLTISSPIS